MKESGEDDGEKCVRVVPVNTWARKNESCYQHTKRNDCINFELTGTCTHARAYTLIQTQALSVACTQWWNERVDLWWNEGERSAKPVLTEMKACLAIERQAVQTLASHTMDIKVKKNMSKHGEPPTNSAIIASQSLNACVTGKKIVPQPRSCFEHLSMGYPAQVREHLRKNSLWKNWKRKQSHDFF